MKKVRKKFGGFKIMLYLCNEEITKVLTLKQQTIMRNLYNNYDINESDWFEAFKEYCEINEIDYSQYDDDCEEYFNWLHEQLNMDWEDLMTNLKYDKENNVDCVVTGKVGRWNGNFDIEAKHFSTLEDAILACVKDCDYIVINEINGAIDVESIHHDGHNYFTIHKLNEKGYDAHCEDEELNNEEYFDKFNIEW